MRKRKKADDQLAPWIISYGDMVTLLLTFFVLLYSYSLVDLRKFKALSESMRAALGGAVLEGGGEKVIQLFPESSPLPRPAVSKEVQETAAKAEAFLKKEGLGSTATVIPEERGVVIRFQDTVFFDTGQAELRPQAVETARKLAGFLRTIPNHIRIEGHADNVPISNAQFRSNWELSVARATRFLTFLQVAGGLPPQQLSAAGYGEYRPVASNATPEGRQKNRRVDVVLLREALSESEPQGNGARQ
ncbi:MAG TPA: flagellar motor protein MotB [Firmicutes bacterium]|nr:flagellar motor protein MotB [Bacillota bacterium]